MGTEWTTARRTLTASCLALAVTTAFADEGTVGPGLDGCLDAALKERPGVVHAWKELTSGSEESYLIAIVNAEGRIAETTCVASAPGNFKFDDQIGMRRYEVYSRIKVPEQSARGTAPQVFVGPVRITRMEIDLNWRGRAAYEYHLALPSGRTAVAKVDTITGILMHAEVLAP